MKKLLMYFAMVAAMIGSFTSCNSIDEDFEGVYTFWQPYTNWEAGMSDIKAYMNKQPGWKMNIEVNGKSISYVHKATGMEVFYELKGDKLGHVNLSYINCPEELDHMKKDWAEKFHFKWDEFGTADIKELDCNALASVLIINNTSYVKLELNHEHK